MAEFILEENNEKQFKTAMESEMNKAIKHFEHELVAIRSGRAHTSMVEDIKVAAWGQEPAPLRTLAAISAPTARLIVVQPWDTSIIPDIEKGITSSDFGVTPVNDGKIIRLQLPEMSTTRREELNKILGKKLEECRVGIRNVRKDFQNLMRDSKKDKKISENFANRLEDVLQKVTDTFINKAQELADKKAHDLRAF